MKFSLNTINTLVQVSAAALLAGCSQNLDNKDFQSLQPSAKASANLPEEAFRGQHGSQQSTLLNGQKVQYRLIGDQAVFENDIILSDKDLHHDEATEVDGTGRSKTTARWPGKTVYYVIDASLPNQSRVLDAMAHWEANTPIRFVARTTQRGYVLFRAGAGCSSNVGYVGSVQYVTLDNVCSTGNTIHEIGHTVGLWHEHTRADRDSYININTTNITSGYESEFQTYSARGLDGFDYTGGLDFGSVMLYGSYDFSKNGQPVMTKKDGSTFNSQRDGLSQTDINTVLSMYP